MEPQVFEQRCNYIVVKNEEGHRKQVKISDYNEFQKNRVKGHPLYGYEYDLEWDLSHGFTEVNKVFERIRNGHRKDKSN